MVSTNMVQVPGISGLVQGLPWPVTNGRVYRPASHETRLESFDAFIQKARASGPCGTFSPASTPGTVDRNRAETPRPAMSLRTGSVPIASAGPLQQQVESALAVPNVAGTSSGGWFDLDNWLCKIVWSKVKDMDIDTLEHQYFHREARFLYGLNHTSTRSKGMKDMDSPITDCDYYVNNKKRANENHKSQERDRRDRHRILQREGDECTSTMIYELSEDVLQKVKGLIKKIAAHEENYPEPMPVHADGKKQAAAAAAKKTGKDDQLLSAVLSQWLSGIIVLREREARVEASERLKETEDTVSQLKAELAHLRQHPTTDNESHRDFSTAFVQPQLPPPIAGCKRRPVDLDLAAANATPVDKFGGMLHVKRRRVGIEQSGRALPVRGSCRPPPSPTPSCDECGSHFRAC